MLAKKGEAMSGATVVAATQTEKETNTAVNFANDLPGLVTELKAVNPALAGQIEGKAAVASGTLWGYVALTVVQALVGYFAIDWTNAVQVQFASYLALAMQVAFGVIATWVEKAPITGFFTKKVLPAGPAATATTASVTSLNQRGTAS